MCQKGLYVNYADMCNVANHFNVPVVKLWSSEEGETQIKDVKVFFYGKSDLK
jgi:hypothetical protein